MNKKEKNDLFWVIVNCINIFTLTLLMAFAGFGYVMLMVLNGYSVIPTILKGLILTALGTVLMVVSFKPTK